MIEPLLFQHSSTNFPLYGAHATTGCNECHGDLDFSKTDSNCFSCHEAEFQNATDPDHSDFQGISITCEDCHSEIAWEPANFDHDSTSFQLRGSHRTTTCAACHEDGYVGTPSDCFSCHLADFDGATDPDHQAFPITCEDCHAENTWNSAVFDHNATAFPLRGAHQAADCASCHRDGFAGTPTDCFSCHQADFDGATDPDHLGFPTTCEDCHSESAWEPANFDHNLTAFPLNGAHRSLDCLACHGDGYQGTPTNCFSCHQADYEGATDPDHRGFPTTCEDCHSESAWEPASFDHNLTAFPLDGAHRSLDCLACHEDGYQGTPTDCFSCHQNDYQRTDDPDHIAAGFPTTCEDCHNTSDWDDTDWDHDDFFPIYSGNHRRGRAWTTCEQCHVSPGNYRHFECIECHEHNRSRMDNEHRGIGGYRYESQACFSCHPDGDD
ncbi:MAG: hypothetical protein K0U98_18290 [Deltaproteobacteria bacterium]|nr:hypothetical protein [Deltaproteobacteria bacterium]